MVLLRDFCLSWVASCENMSSWRATVQYGKHTEMLFLKGKRDADTNSDTDSGSSLTSCSTHYVSSEVIYSPEDISCD